MRAKERLLLEVHTLRLYVEEMCDQLGEDHPSVQDWRDQQQRQMDELGPVDDHPGMHHKNPHATELHAAEWVTPTVGTDLHLIMGFLYEASDHGCTDWELRRLLNKPNPLNSSAQARRTDLSARGWVEWSGRSRPGEFGVGVNIWVLTPVGRQKYEQSMKGIAR